MVTVRETAFVVGISHYYHRDAVSAAEHMRAIVIYLFHDAVEGYHSPFWCGCELVSSLWICNSFGGMVMVGGFSNDMKLSIQLGM